MQVRPRAIAFVSVLLLGSLVWGNDHKLSPDLKGRHSAGAVDLIVQFRVAPAQKHRDRIMAHGGLVKQHLSTVKGLLVSLPDQGKNVAKAESLLSARFCALCQLAIDQCCHSGRE